MIPLPSLLFFGCNPTPEGEQDDHPEPEDIDQTRESAAIQQCNEKTPKAASGVPADDKEKHNRAGKRRRRRTIEQQSIPPPPSPPSPLRIRRIPKVDPPRLYQHQVLFGDNHRAPFWERQQQEEEQARSPRKHAVASIRRHSQLFAVLVTLASFVAVDDYNMLPSGLLVYVVALSFAWENWTDEVEENRRYIEKLHMYHNKLKSIEREVEKAKFEYHVLRNKPHVDIVTLRKRRKNLPAPVDFATQNDSLDTEFDFDAELDHSLEDQWVVYAEERRHRHRQQQPR